MVETYRKIPTVAKKIGIDRSTLYKWIRELEEELIEKGLIYRRKRGRRTFYYITQEEEFINFLKKRAYIVV